MSKCNICGTEQTPIFTGLILHKYTIQYFQCPKCGFISTEKPHWLEEAYSDAIADSDTGYAYRNLDFAKRVSRILKQNFKKDATFLDYGAGYGLFVRLMRDNGFNFHYYDLYCNNIFAKGLELPSNHSVDAYTALEVFEHLEDPTTELETMLKHTDTIIFSTVLRKEDYTNINQWWYFTPETGQHIAIFTKESLAELAKKFNLYLYTNNKDIHILTKRRISWCSMKFDLLLSVIHQKIEKLMYRKRTSLLQMDYQEVKRKLSESSTK